MKIIKKQYTNEWPQKLISKTVLYNNCGIKEWYDLHDKCLTKCATDELGIPNITSSTREIHLVTRDGKRITFMRYDK